MLRAGTILLDSNAGTYVDKVLESVTSVKAVKLRQSMHDEQKKKILRTRHCLLNPMVLVPEPSIGLAEQV